MPLTKQQIRAYETEGFVSGIPIENEAGALRYQRQFDALEAKEGRENCQTGMLDRHFDLEFIWQLATHPKILECIEDLIGPDVLLLATHAFCKYGPQQEKFVAWHQDVTYWGLEPPEALTAWYAIDDSDCENGCMRVIPGTHLGFREHGKSEREGNLLSVNQEAAISEDEEKGAVDFVLKAGEISIHHGTIIHGSLPNRSTRRRCGLTIRYIPPWVKPVDSASVKRWKAILLRGQARYKNFETTPKPFPMS
jgi:ectoine hydroxylase-related dioxygenase (phytanoyl-CoA dioxygenase family)